MPLIAPLWPIYSFLFFPDWRLYSIIFPLLNPTQTIFPQVEHSTHVTFAIPSEKFKRPRLNLYVDQDVAYHRFIQNIQWRYHSLRNGFAQKTDRWTDSLLLSLWAATRLSHEFSLFCEVENDWIKSIWCSVLFDLWIKVVFPKFLFPLSCSGENNFNVRSNPAETIVCFSELP